MPRAICKDGDELICQHGGRLIEHVVPDIGLSRKGAEIRLRESH